MRLPVSGIAVLSVLALVFGPCAQAQDASMTQQELVELVIQLKERVSALESLLNAQEEQPSEAVVIDKRIDETEEQVVQRELRDPNEFTMYWKEGIRFDTDDGQFKLKLNGRIQNDWAWFSDSSEPDSAFGDLEDGTEFRRARLSLAGTIYGDYEFKSQYDFAGGAAEFKDMYISAQNIPILGRISIGQFKEPFGFDELASSKYITFMERNQPSETFTPGRNTGLMVSNTVLNERMTWAAGVFRSTDDFGDGSDDGGYNLTGRLTGLPLYKDDGERLLHLGLAISHRNIDDDLEYASSPEAHLSEDYVSTGSIATNDLNTFGGELALNFGPAWFQSEYIVTQVNTDSLGNRSFGGYYLQAGYFLTGERRPYKNDEGVWGRLKPKNNFTISNGSGMGAWEVAARFSHTDLDDGLIRGGNEDNTTLALNWYLNPNLRIMLNYIRADIDHDLYNGTVESFQSRFQVDF